MGGLARARRGALQPIPTCCRTASTLCHRSLELHQPPCLEHQPSAEGAGHPLAVTIEARARDLVVDSLVEERLVAGPKADPRLPRSQRLLALAEGLEALA